MVTRKQRALAKAPLVVEAGLALLLIWVVSGWLEPDANVQAGTAQETANASATAPPNVEELVAVHLFGEKPPEPVRAVQPARPVVQLPLNIKLLGTVVADEGAAAIVKPANGPDQQVFFVGDAIQPGVILQTVGASDITVERGGKVERVAMEQGQPVMPLPLPEMTTAELPINPVQPPYQADMQPPTDGATTAEQQ